MWRGLLIFVIGVLVGANATYYVMSQRGQPAPGPATGPAAEVSAPRAAEPLQRTPVPASTAVPLPPTLRPGALIVPVQGVAPAQLQNTFDDARSEGRVHEAIDIMATRGTPVFAVADGPIEKLFDSRQGGITLYQFDPAGTFAYYYAHLDRYADGITEGRVLKQGDLVGYVGSTGNANPDGPHLHFAVYVLGPDKKWWDGTPINPYPLMGGT